MRLFRLRWKITSDTPERELSRLMNSDVVFFHARRGEGGLFFETSPLEKKKVTALLRECSFEWSVSRVGLLAPLFRHLSRAGLILGTVLSLFLIYLSTFFVWSVRIEGNEEMSDREITSLLRECGFYEGVPKRSVDTNEIENLALMRCHELSFLSINCHGLVSDVVVHERRTAKKETDSKLPYNLVADTDGVVVSTLVLDGQLMVGRGDTVAKGELLVSGLMESTSGIVRTGHSRGKVFARTSRSLEFSTPLTLTEKKYIGEEERRSLRVLGKRFLGELGEGDFDVVVTEEELSLFGFSLPVTLETRHLMYFEEKEVELSEEEALARATDEYKKYVSTELDSASIIKEDFSHEVREGVLYLKIELSAVENIAVEKKIERL